MFSTSMGRLLGATVCFGAVAGGLSPAWGQTAQISLTPGIIRTYAGGGTPASGVGDGGQATAAKLAAPRSIAFDSAGNLYIADTSNNRIRKVTTAGVISTVAGTGTAGSTGNGMQATLATLNVPSADCVRHGGELLHCGSDGELRTQGGYHRCNYCVWRARVRRRPRATWDWQRQRRLIRRAVWLSMASATCISARRTAIAYAR